MNNIKLPAPIDGIQHYAAQISNHPVLSREEEQEIALRYYETGDRQAAQQLVLSNLRFVVKVAHEYKAYGFRVADLIQEGNVGLLLAVKKFDPHKGFRLISYAVWWIRAYIQNFILRSWSLVRIGTTRAQRKLFYKLRASKQNLLGGEEADLDRALNEDEAHALAEKMALKGNEVIEMDARLSRRDLSLNAPIGEEQQTTHQDLLCAHDNQEELVSSAQTAAQLSGEVQAALATLKPREQYIVEQRLMADKPLTLREIGEHFGISRERTRQLETRAKQKLREVLKKAA